jgi:hypothetical protein
MVELNRVEVSKNGNHVYRPKTMTHGISWIILGIALAWGCAPVRFEQRIDCLGYTRCFGVNANRNIEWFTEMPVGTVDILIVNDNSASMLPIQSQLGAKFSNFIQELDLRQVDYRIAMVTTDVSTAKNTPRPINQNGALQDGRPLVFSDGSIYLTPQSPNKEQVFLNAVERGETSQCEAFLRVNKNVDPESSAYLNQCPSNDERGFYASSLFVRNHSSNVLRPSSTHFAVIVLSNEEVRSGLFTATDFTRNYLLDDLDMPATLKNEVSAKYPGKTMSIHPIIIRPGNLLGSLGSDLSSAASQILDQTFAAFKVGGSFSPSARPILSFSGSDQRCLGEQINSEIGTSGSYGSIYALGALLTGGQIADICAKDYSTQLREIARSVQKNEISLNCAEPQILSVKTYDVSSQALGEDIPFEQTGNVLKFSNNFASRTPLYINFICPGLI